MSDKQLTLVADWERDKEQKCAADFQSAQQHLLLNQQKLDGLQQYRLDYIRQMHSKGSDGVEARHFHQHNQFIGKLDKACEQQTVALQNAQKVAEQRKVLWLQQQRKRKAIEHLIEQKQAERRLKQEKQEQQMLDELALQKFLRQKVV